MAVRVRKDVRPEGASELGRAPEGGKLKSEVPEGVKLRAGGRYSQQLESYNLAAGGR